MGKISSYRKPYKVWFLDNICTHIVISIIIFTETFHTCFFLFINTIRFGTAEKGIYLHTQTDKKRFIPSHLKAKTKVKKDYCKRHAICRRFRSTSKQPITTSIFDGISLLICFRSHYLR